ncbi:MAG: hypothetical protein Q7K16_02220 [Candidatus Azambacteria bacterium]|nr:hypothetical protein [Candidatus Azambacteria bacterium]
MKSGDNLVKTFAGCFRLLAKLNASMQDGFFINLIDNSSRRLLTEYIEFLRGNGKNIAKYPNIVRYTNHVAQCSDRLKARINGILKLLEIIKHVGQADDMTTPLLLERELLKLELLLLNHNNSSSVVGAGTDNSLDNRQKNKNLKKPVEPQELGVAHRQIAEFIRSKERVQNVEVFSQFTETTRRTLKRKLSELVKVGTIKRLALGKKVFYAVSG